MDGDVHFIADSAFKKPCVEVMGAPPCVETSCSRTATMRPALLEKLKKLKIWP